MRLSHKNPGTFRTAFAIAITFFTAFSAGCGAIQRQVEERQREAESRDSQPPVWAPPADASVHLALGNPSNASASDRDNFLIIGEGHALSYNNTRGSANWASWRTTAEDLGERLERPDFRPDPRLPKNFRRIEYYTYSGSGYDRGHLVPSADRFRNRSLNEETFYMSNIVPQKSALNQYPWEKLESYVRSRVRNGSDAYNIAGCYGTKARLRDRVTVPESCWKVVVFVKKGQPVTLIDSRTTVIAVDMPNAEGIENNGWPMYKTTIRAIEQRAGLDLLSALPVELQNELETQIRTH